LTVAFLEDLLLAADEAGIPLTRIEPILGGRRTREQWERAIAYLKPGFGWEDGIGAVPLGPLPVPVGTVEVHRGWPDPDANVCHMDVRLLQGTIQAGYLIRREISKDFYSGWSIAELGLRSVDIPDEYHLLLAVERPEVLDSFASQMAMLKFDRSVWQIARPPRPPLDGQTA
jgi:hypothetical protein